MTATAVAVRPRVLDGQGEELGPVATFGAYVFLVVSFLFQFQVLGPTTLPVQISVGMLAGSFGVLVLAPRWVARRIPVSLLVLVMIGWILGSVMWTDDSNGSAYALQRDVPILIGMMLIAGMTSLRYLVDALLWAVRLGALVSIVAVAALPQARVHIDSDGEIPDLEGWHGLFPHKTIMASFLLFGMLTILTFDRTKVMKYGTLALIAVLMLGSDSVTGLSAMMLAFGVWVWLQLYQNLDVRNSSVFVISTVSLVLFAVIGVVVSLASIIGASGRDLTLTGRTFIWSAAFDLAKERPLTGWGYGGIFTDNPVSPATAELWRAIGFKAAHSHNGFIDMMVQLGLVGVGIWVVLYLTTLFGGLRMLRERPKVGAWVVSVLVLQIYTSISENNWLGYGWLTILVMLRVLLLRRVGMDLDTGRQLSDHLDRFRQPGRARALAGRAGAGRAVPSRAGAEGAVATP